MESNDKLNISDRDIQNDDMPYRVQRHHRKYGERGKFFMLRNILNIVFIIGAIAGMLIYFFKSDEAGTIIVLGAMAFKMCECVIRLVK